MHPSFLGSMSTHRCLFIPERLAGKDEILMDLSRRGDLLFVLEHHQKVMHQLHYKQYNVERVDPFQFATSLLDE